MNTAYQPSTQRPGPQGLWVYFVFWTLLLMVLAAFAAPIAHAEPDAKVFGDGANLAPVGAPVDSARPSEAKRSADAAKPAYLTEDQPLELKDYEEPKPAEPAPWWQQLFGFLFKLVLVVGLIAVSLAVVKKLSGGRMALNLPNTKGRNIVVLESTHLNPQQAIHMISLGGERLLVVGAGPQGLNTLTEITDPAQVRLFLQAQKTTPAASSFNQVFDIEKVVQDTNSELLSETFAEVENDPRYRRAREWPGQ